MPPAPSREDPASVSGWLFDANIGVLRAPNGKERRVIGHERAVLNLMTQEPERHVGVDRLAALLDIPDDPQGKRRIEVIMSRLRKNAERAVGISLPLFLTRGVGYQLRHVSRIGTGY